MMKTMALGSDFAKELENNRKRHLESEENSKMAEIRCMMLEAEVEHLKQKNKELEEQIARIQKDMRNEEKGKPTIVDLTGEEDERDDVLQVITENKDLKSEKIKAETELRFWKENVNRLVSQVCEMESKLNTKGMNENCNKVKKRLPFEDESYDKKIAPSTPGFTPPPSSVVIDLSDEDLNHNQIPKVSDSILKNVDEDDLDCFNLHSRTSTKRKRSCSVVTSDDETSYDDNALICTLVKKVKEDERRRPLKRLRKLDDITFELNKCGNSSTEDDERSKSGDESEIGLNEFKLTSNKISSKNDLNLKWGFERDMLSEFRKDPELCMKAVCALYRQQQTSNEGKIHKNARGFNQTDVLRGSKVAEFLTDGDSVGDLNKTVEELKRYDTKGIELCTTLAIKYSKQLFEIYKNKEDPYF